MTTREFVVNWLEPILERYSYSRFKAGYLPLDEVIALIDEHFEPKERCGKPMDIMVDGVPMCCNKPVGHEGRCQWSLSREN